MNYYNEHDPRAAEWLRELIKQGHISNGLVDERDIQEISAADLRGFVQCHFFAGIGGWSYALRLAGWPDDKPVWTGSCPCQPFSVAGKGLGVDDERHLWPYFRNLIGQCGPAIVYGEQVASKDGREWFAGVSADLEKLAYASAAADLCAAGIAAPHPRQRIFWLALPTGQQRRERGGVIGSQPSPANSDTAIASRSGGGANSKHRNGGGEQQSGESPKDWRPGSSRSSGLGDSYCSGLIEQRRAVAVSQKQSAVELSGNAGFWSRYELIPMRDGKTRRIEPGTFPLAHGVSGRVGLLRGYGNAIVPELAAQFIQASQEAVTTL